MKGFQDFAEERGGDLTPTEFQLLQAHARRQGELATEKPLVWAI